LGGVSSPAARRSAASQRRGCGLDGRGRDQPRPYVRPAALRVGTAL